MIIAILFSLALRAADLSKTTDALLGATAINVDSGKRVSVRGDERFPMGSVYKLPIALTLLRRVDRGEVSLAQRETIPPEEFAPGWSPLRDEAKGHPITRTAGELLTSMLGISDNSASDRLLRLAGGPGAVTRRMRELGVRGIDVNRSEKQIAADIARDGKGHYFVDRRDTATPNALADLLLLVARGRDGLTPTSHARLLKIMTESATNQRIRDALPAGTVAAHKSGVMPGTLNDVAIVTSPNGKRAIIVILTKGSQHDTDKHRVEVLGELARAAWGDVTP